MNGLIDSTLREGEQMAGVYFSFTQKREIVRLLSLVGVGEIELGIGAQNPEAAELIASARTLAPYARLSLWSRCLARDIDACARLKPDVLALSVPVSDLHIHKRLGKDRMQVLDMLQCSIEHSKCAVRYVSVGFEDATRADGSFLQQAFERAVEAGADRIRFSDTVGTAAPTDVISLARAYAGRFDVDVAFHAHNDFGMATSNAITALESGFEWVDVSALGIGERSGIARMEEIVAWLRVKHNVSQYDPARAAELCRYISEIAEIPIPPHSPIAGDKIFTCESGLHLDGIAKEPKTYYPYPPELIGGRHQSLIGKKSGRSSLRARMIELSLPVSDDRTALVLSQVRTQSRLAGRPLNDCEIRDIAENR